MTSAPQVPSTQREPAAARPRVRARDLRRRSGDRDRSRRRRALPLLTVVAAVAVVAVALWRGDLAAPTEAAPGLLALFAALLLLAEARPVAWVRRQPSPSVALQYAGALMLILPGLGVVVVTAAASLLGGLLHTPRRPLATLWAAASDTLAVGAGAGMLWALQQQGALLAEQPVGAAFAGAYLAAAATVLAVRSVTAHTPPPRRPGRSRPRSAPDAAELVIDAVLLAMAPVTVVVAQRGLLLLAFVLPATYVVYRSAHQTLRRRRERGRDPLTGLHNRAPFLDCAAEAVAQAGRRNTKVGLLILDLDAFGLVNERWGRAAGDAVLASVAARLTEGVRDTDTVARLGGDEFGVLLSDIGSEAVLVALAERLCAEISGPLEIDDAALMLRASAGVAVFPDDCWDPQSLLRRADVAMHLAKERSCGTVVYSQVDDHRTDQDRLRLVAGLAEAMERDQLVVAYQPKIDCSGRHALGLEALLRWHHPALGVIPPEDFLPLAEHVGWYGRLTPFVLERALQACAEWRADGHAVTVSVNLTRQDLANARFPEAVRDLLARHDVPPQALELEFAERQLPPGDGPEQRAVLEQLAAMGVAVTLDDFGAEAATLTRLRDLPVRSVKLDPRLLDSGREGHPQASLASAIIDLCHRLHIQSVAESVEDRSTAARWAALHCDALQGFLLAPPMTAEAAGDWLAGPRGWPSRQNTAEVGVTGDPSGTA